MSCAHIILTDSGGVQEEAPSLGKPVLVMRNVTERCEALETGSVKLVGSNCDSIISETIRLIDDLSEYERMSRKSFLYGDGHASVRIRDILLANLLRDRSKIESTTTH
jgi:UDP-N-acetylglucosamine 2-epimerase